MQVSVNHNHAVKTLTFPCLMVSVYNDNLVIYAWSRDDGVVISKGGSAYEEGTLFSTKTSFQIRDNFMPMNGSVTLTND